MNLIPTPKVTISDAQVVCVLRRAVAIINPVLDVLAETDPLGLKDRTRRTGTAGGGLDKAADALAWILDTADVPGTAAWDDMDTESRIDWWVHRVGAVNTVAVAFPGVFGVLADRLPIQDLLGFANQAIVLCAVAREVGIRDRDEQVRLLAAVLCHRELSPDAVTGVAGTDQHEGISLSPSAVPQAIWRLMGVLDAVGGEVAKRPRPRALFRYVGMLPAVGAVADYLGEYGALSRASKAAQRWIGQH